MGLSHELIMPRAHIVVVDTSSSISMPTAAVAHACSRNHTSHRPSFDESPWVSKVPLLLLEWLNGGANDAGIYQ